MQHYIMFYCLETLTKQKQVEKGKGKPITHKAKVNNSFGPNKHFPLFLGVQITSIAPINLSYKKFLNCTKTMKT